MHERHFEPERASARLDIDQLGAACCEVGKRGTHVVDLVGDVMHSRPATREETPDRRVVVERRQQLDAAAADADRRGLDALLVDAPAMLEPPAEQLLVRPDRLVEVGDRDPDVVNSPRLKVLCVHAGDATAATLLQRTHGLGLDGVGMRRQLVSGLVLIAALAAIAGGCGGGGSKSNGEASKSASTVFADAKQAAIGAKSVHVTGSLNDSGQSLKLDLVLAHGSGKGTMAENGLSFDIIRVGDAAYVKGSDAFLRKFAGAGAAQLLHDKWLKGPTTGGQFASLAPLTDVTALFNGAFSKHGKLVNNGETTYKGQKAVAIKDASDGSILYVSATGKPYPLGATEGGSSKGSIAFDHWDETVSIAAPKGSVDITKLGG